MQLKEFKEIFIELMLQFAWRQWSSLGVAGNIDKNITWVIDPEALLIFSASIARYDQRLFDEILDWLDKNERFINVQRLRRILEIERFTSADVISAIAGYLNRSRSGIKWKGLAESYSKQDQSLFFLRSGKNMPVVGEKDGTFKEYGFIRNPIINRGLSTPFKPKMISSLLLQLRGITGISSRSEILLYLIANHSGSITEIANQTYYAWRSVQDVLFEMGHSGILNFNKAKKARIYHLDNKQWISMLLKEEEKSIVWICWPPLFKAFEIILNTIDETLLKKSKLEQAAELRRIMVIDLAPLFEKAGFGSLFSSDLGYDGEEYLDYWLKSIMELITGKLS